LKLEVSVMEDDVGDDEEAVANGEEEDLSNNEG
jgi:hypothetical protein